MRLEGSSRHKPIAPHAPLRSASVEIGPATEHEIEVLAEAMTETFPYDHIPGFNRQQAEDLLRSSGTVYAARGNVRFVQEKVAIGGFVYNEHGFTERPAIRYPLTTSGDQKTLADIIRSGADFVATELYEKPHHIYVTLPAHNKGVVRELYVSVDGLPRFDTIVTIPDYLIPGNSEEVLRWTRMPPRSPKTNAEYGKTESDVRKYEIKGGIGITNLAADEVDPDLLTACAVQMSAVDPWRYYGYSLDDCEAKLNAPGARLFVAHHKSNGFTPIGFMLFHPEGLIGLPEIGYLCVFKHYRGMGVGKALIEEGMQHVRNNSCAMDGAPPRIFLSVSEPNTRARKIYEELGFQRIGAEPGYNTAEEEEILLCCTVR